MAVTILLVILIALLSFWLSSLWTRGRALESRVLALGVAIAPEALVRESEEVRALSTEVSAVQHDWDDLVSDARPALAVASLFGWVPWIGHDLYALSPLAERASADLEVASSAIQTLSDLQVAYQDLVIQSLDPSADPAASRTLVEVARTAGIKLRGAQETLTAAHARTPRIQPRAIAPLWTKLQLQEQQLEASLAVGAAAADLLASLAETQANVRPLGQDGEGQQATNAQAVLQGLRDLRYWAEAARDSVLAAQRTVPQMQGLLGPLEALVTLGQGAELAGESLLAILSAFGEGQGGPFHNGAGLSRALAIAEAEDAQLERALELLRAGRLELERMGSSGASLPIPFVRGLQESGRLAGDLEEAVRLVRDITPIAPALLGIGGSRTYLVLAHSPDELRPTGGFVGAIWFVTFVQGELENIEYYDVVLVDDWDRLADYPKPPPALEEHMGAWVWLTRDVSWEPHFPVVAEIAEDMIEIGRQRRVDGVIAVNLWTFQRWVEALGEIPSPDGGPPVTDQTFLNSFTNARDTEEKSYLDLFLRSLLTHLEESADQRSMVRLAASMHTLLQERQLFIYANDPIIQQRLSRLGWAGEMRETSGDYLYVADSNIGWSKVDRNIGREFSYRIILDTAGPNRAALTLTYRNLSGPQASGCESQWMPEERGDTYTDLLQACYWDYIRAYVPAGVQLQATPSLPLPPNSISGRRGRRKEGDSTLTIEAAYGKTVLGGLLLVPAGEQRDVTFLYDLPSSVLERKGDQLRYRLLLQPQAGILGRLARIDIDIPTGYSVSSSSLPIAAINDTSVSYFFDLITDTMLDLVLMPSSQATSP